MRLHSRARRFPMGGVVGVAALVAGSACASGPAGPRPGPGAAAVTAPTPVCTGPAPVSLGLDAFRNLDRLSYLDLSTRTAGMTTADPAGTNLDSTNPVRVLPDGRRVLFDGAGPGILTFLRMQGVTGGPWSLSVDGGAPLTVQPSDLGQFAPSGGTAALLPYPLSLTPAQSEGSSLVMSSLGFGQSLTWTSAAPNANFYSLWRKLPFGTPTPPSPTPQSVALVANLLRAGASAALPGNLSASHGMLSLPSLAESPVVTLSGDGPRQIRVLHFRVPFDEKVRFGNSRLRIYWDGESTPSVDAPVKFLVGDGAGVYQPAGRPLVGGFLAHAGGDGKTYMDYDLYWPMPYERGARISVLSTTPSVLPGISWSVETEPFNVPQGWWAPFHATSTSEPSPRPGSDMTFLDTRGSGRIVGTVVNFGAVGTTLEGNPEIYIDDANTPQVVATGTEEWGLGGSYWQGGVQTSLPLGGLPSSTNNPPGTDVEGAAEYRFLVADSITFNRHVVVRWQHGPVDDVSEPYQAVVLWYGTPTATAFSGDNVTVTDAARAASHHLIAPDATTYGLTAGYPYSVTSPVLAEQVSATRGSMSFTMHVVPGATGAFLRRSYDSASSGQRADVFVDGMPAGTWYNPGAFAGSDPAGLPRRIVEDEFPLPPSLIQGKSSVRIEIRDHPIRTPANGPWTAISYSLYSLVPPGCLWHLNGSLPTWHRGPATRRNGR